MNLRGSPTKRGRERMREKQKRRADQAGRSAELGARCPANPQGEAHSTFTGGCCALGTEWCWIVGAHAPGGQGIRPGVLLERKAQSGRKPLAQNRMRVLIAICQLLTLCSAPCCFILVLLLLFFTLTLVYLYSINSHIMYYWFQR